MLSEVTEPQVHDWSLFAAVEPFEPERGDLRCGLLRLDLFRIERALLRLGGARPSSREPTLEELVPRYEPAAAASARSESAMTPIRQIPKPTDLVAKMRSFRQEVEVVKRRRAKG